MILKAEQRVFEQREHMRGGPGTCSVASVPPAALCPHVRLVTEITIPPGAGIGPHRHEAETEYYWILEGRGLVDEGDSITEVGPGDVVITGGGAQHSIINREQVPLRFLAVIVTEA